MALSSKEALDEALELVIESTRDQMEAYFMLGFPEAARRAFDNLREAVGQRSPERIAEMEREFSIDATHAGPDTKQ